MLVEQITQKALNLFNDICRIPHGSGNEKEIGLWLQKWANTHSFDNSRDEIGNVIINVPGCGKCANQNPLVFQGHMDMVCVKNADSNHDFLKDGLETYIEDGWMRAKNTTLGADNGIAIAISMALAEEKLLEHPPLELLFTVDEERGLTGANYLKPNTLKSKILLNLDSEEEGEFTIGCAGGRDTHIQLPLVKESCAGCQQIIIQISGLYGGHSGMEINQQKANAIQLITRMLYKTNQAHQIRISDIKSGLAHNAIPRDAFANITVMPDKLEAVMQTLEEIKQVLYTEFKSYEKQMEITIKKAECICENKNHKCECTTYNQDSTDKLINLLFAMPHGVTFFNQNNMELVETSNNLAVIKIENDSLQILTSQRSSIASRNDYITNKIEAVAKLAGAKVESGNGYPSWQPNWDSELLKKCKAVYKDLFNKEAKINVIHAGLECGIIGAKHNGMDMISMGPNIKTPHSPEERMEIASVQKVIAFLIELMTSF